jgi:hypothetical protein
LGALHDDTSTRHGALYSSTICYAAELHPAAVQQQQVFPTVFSLVRRLLLFRSWAD